MISEELDFTNPKKLRLKAEEKLKKVQKKEDKPATETDVKKLLHELQVHQIELELQNQELRQAYETAEIALKKYTMLYDLAPMGYFTIDSESIICDLNFTGADMLGERRFSLLNSNFRLFIFKDSLATFNSFFSKVYSSNSKESCEVLLVQGKNQLRFAYMEGIVTGDEHKCLLSVVDISEFKKPQNT